MIYQYLRYVLERYGENFLSCSIIFIVYFSHLWYDNHSMDDIIFYTVFVSIIISLKFNNKLTSMNLITFSCLINEQTKQGKLEIILQIL